LYCLSKKLWVVVPAFSERMSKEEYDVLEIWQLSKSCQILSNNKSTI